MYKPNKKELNIFKLKYNLTAQQIADICEVSKKTVESWLLIKDDKRHIPKLAWKVLYNHVVLGKKLEEAQIEEG